MKKRRNHDKTIHTYHRQVHKADRLAYWAGREIHIHTRILAGNLQNKIQQIIFNYKNIDKAIKPLLYMRPEINYHARLC